MKPYRRPELYSRISDKECIQMGNKNDDHARMRELILYILKQCEDDPTFSFEKLKTILFLSDFTSYQRTRQSITGEQYFKEPEADSAADMLNKVNSSACFIGDKIKKIKKELATWENMAVIAKAMRLHLRASIAQDKKAHEVS